MPPDRLGAFIGADGKDIAFVDNATTGCNAVLRSLRLQPGDEIVVLTHGYGAVRNTVRYVTEQAGAIVDHIASGSALVLPLQRIACPGRRHLAANFGRGL